MKIFQLNDYDWWIGPTLDACIDDYKSEFCNSEPDEDLFNDPREITDSELDSLMFFDSDENDMPTNSKRSFREQLAIEIEQGGRFPRLFASTEV